MALSGVRSSCESVARNSSFTRFAALGLGSRVPRVGTLAAFVDGQPGAVQLLRDPAVAVVVTAAGVLQVAERQHAQYFLAEPAIGEDRGLDPETSEEFEVLAVEGRGAEPRIVDFADVLRAAGREDPGRRVFAGTRRRDESADALEPALARAGGGPRHALAGAVAPYDVDDAQVGQHRHDQAGHPLERLLVVQRRGERGAGVGQQPLEQEAVLPLGDVAEVDGQAAVTPRVGLDLEPSVPRLTRDARTWSADPLGDRPAGRFHLEPGAHRRREEPPVVAGRAVPSAAGRAGVRPAR